MSASVTFSRARKFFFACSFSVLFFRASVNSFSLEYPVAISVSYSFSNSWCFSKVSRTDCQLSIVVCVLERSRNWVTILILSSKEPLRIIESTACLLSFALVKLRPTICKVSSPINMELTAISACFIPFLSYASSCRPTVSRRCFR